MEQAVSEQTKVLFPRLQELEVAQQRRDEHLRSRAMSSTAPSAWSPSDQQAPYKIYDRNTPKEGDEDSDDESEEAEEKAEAAADATVNAAPVDPETATWEELEAEELRLAESEEPDPLDEELGFRYKGPEPTLHGDWAHKGRCTDF